ncbi:MAG: hypothetical protein DRP47_02360 [Candidatus Zixiibacteriota bacterium]|nr:MAG: hypothetical protein DRP47_02360 [candidate division Zixibacteria bacterium]
MLCYRHFLLIGLIITVVLGSGLASAVEQSVNFKIGYFEAGQSITHSLLREELERQIQALSPENTKMVFVPYGYASGDWKRDSCKTLARLLSATEGIDLMVTVGPWVVEDLLEAGYSRPILAMRQLDPQATGLVGPDKRPVANNLTVHVQPKKIEDDLTILTKLIPIKKLGLLFFPSDTVERNAVINRVETVGHRRGFETITAEGYDNFNTYAYFKALNQLPSDIDAVYLGPLWAMDINKISAFLRRLSEMKIPAFTWEGISLVNRGAFATGSAHSVVSEARFNAFKIIRIAQGETPTDLPVEFRGGTSLAINEETARLCGINFNSYVLEEAEIIPSPVSEEADHYNLMMAISRAVAANPTYLATSDAVEQATQATRQAVAGYLPNVDISARAGYVDDNTISNATDPLSNSQYRANFNIRQTLFSLNKIEEIKLGSKRKNLSEIDQRRALLDIELAVTEAYIASLQAAELCEIQFRYRQMVEHNLEIAATRFYLEDETRLGDFLRWKDERQQAIARILTARAEKKMTEVTLNTLFNLPIDQPLLLDSNVISGTTVYRDLDLIEKLISVSDKLLQFQQFLVDVAREKHPDLNAYAVRVDIQKSLLALNRDRYFPELALKATLGFANELEDNPGSFKEQHDTWSVFGELSLPLFDGTDRIHERNRLKARLSEIEFKADAAELEMTGNIYRLVEKLISIARVIPRTFRSRELAIQYLGLVSKDYESGHVDIAGVLEAYNHAFDIEVKTIILRGRYFSTMARLTHSVGWSYYDEGSTFRDIFRSYLIQFLEQ